jgi:hypothetical protein
METIRVDFKGYYAEEDIQEELKRYQCSGIYLVYSGSINRNEKTCYPKDLLYIGESENIAKRLAIKSLREPELGLEHESYEEWRHYLEYGDDCLLFSFAKVAEDKRKQIEAAIRYYHYNICDLEIFCTNQDIVSFDYPGIQIRINGNSAYLSNNFSLGT